MSPSQFAATNILPLLARIVLCMAFLPQGWNNLMRDVEYTARDAQRLRELGVRGITDPDPRKADVALGAIRGWESIEPQDQMPGAASSKQTAPSGTTGAAAPAAPATKPTSQDAGTTGTVPAVERPATTPALSPLAPLTQRGLYTLTLLADRARIPFPVEIAWAVAGVQLVGGACVVLGLFSRVWGLLMSVILAALFVTTSLPVIKTQGPFSLGAEQQNMVLAQLGLFVLALGAFLVGPGAMSLDRAIFRRSRRTTGKGKSKSA
jgi:uncharacterized membrane protein YphA (DoxX/SURF4 family)